MGIGTGKKKIQKIIERIKRPDHYFSFKNIAFENEKPGTVMLEDGVIPWKAMIEKLKDQVKVLIEYPIDEEKSQIR